MPRRKSVAVRVGDASIGGGAPVVVQSMTDTDTANVEATTAQVAALARAGSELVRITVDRDEAAKAVGYARRVTPPSFAPFVAVQALLRTFDWETDFRFDYRTGTAMFGEQELEYRRPLYVGETLTVRAEVADVYEKQGKRRFDVIQVSFTAADESGDTAFRGVQSYILFT